MSATTINIEGVEYTIADLPAPVQNLIGVHTRWSAETEEARLNFAKNEAALRELSREIIVAVTTSEPVKSASLPDTAPTGRKKKTS